jgi:hypothetical protein
MSREDESLRLGICTCFQRQHLRLELGSCLRPTFGIVSPTKLRLTPPVSRLFALLALRAHRVGMPPNVCCSMAGVIAQAFASRALGSSNARNRPSERVSAREAVNHQKEVFNRNGPVFISEFSRRVWSWYELWIPNCRVVNVLIDRGPEVRSKNRCTRSRSATPSYSQGAA